MCSQFFFVVAPVIITIISIQSDAKAPAKMELDSDAVPGEFPYMASIRGCDIHICNGAIISSRHILTAAHCFLLNPCKEELVVVTGATENRAIGQLHRIKNITIHDEFKTDENWRWHDDIAIVLLVKEIIFNQFQNSIALPSTDTSGNIVASLLGWGSTAGYNDGSECLRETKVAVLTNKHCNEKYTRIMETQMCGINGKGTGFCNGNSGSPLTYKNEVIGIVSFAASCENGYPDDYTRVFKYIDFISATIAST